MRITLTEKNRTGTRTRPSQFQRTFCRCRCIQMTTTSSAVQRLDSERRSSAEDPKRITQATVPHAFHAYSSIGTIHVISAHAKKCIVLNLSTKFKPIADHIGLLIFMYEILSWGRSAETETTNFAGGSAGENRINGRQIAPRRSHIAEDR
jgi:hypothetical protein